MRKEDSYRPEITPGGGDSGAGFPNIFYAARQALRRHASGGNILIAATVLAISTYSATRVNL